MEKDTAKQFPADGVYLIASIASVIFGIICISNPNEISRMVVLFAGLAVIICGLIELYSFLIAKIKNDVGLCYCDDTRRYLLLGVAANY